MQHLTLRVVWHDNAWNGRICTAPTLNGYCLTLDRIRKERNDVLEDRLAGRSWSGLGLRQLPPCVAESGGFMSDREWVRSFEPPFQIAASGQGEKPRHTTVRVEPYTAFAVPFRWMLRQNQREIEAALPEPLPADETSPVSTSWVFGRARQEALGKQFFDRLTPERSLVFFYCKDGHPLGDTLSRLIVGMGRIQAIGPQGYYDIEGAIEYPYWDRKIHHTIRPDGDDGFLLPYHDYLAPTGDPDEDLRRRALLETIAVAVDKENAAAFSYTSELATADVALSALIRCLDVVRLIRGHGVASGRWDLRERWVNDQLAATWRDRGAFPGAGSALEAFGLRLGTALMLDLKRSGRIAPDVDPWQTLDAILRGTEPAPRLSYESHIARVRPVWINLAEERRSLLYLLSRFDLTPEQARRWLNPATRAKATLAAASDAEILANPYIIAEADLSSDTSPVITLDVVDHGLFPDDAIRVRHPLPAPSAIGDQSDIRRIRGGLVTILRAAAENGDMLLNTHEALERLGKLALAQPPQNIGADWLTAYREQLADALALFDVQAGGLQSAAVSVVQLADLRKREAFVAKVLQGRAAAPLASLHVDWRALLVEAIGDLYQPEHQRHRGALDEQAVALERITTRRLSVLTGRAGTGKTSVMGALLRCRALREDGVLLLAPTGKARVRLEKSAGRPDTPQRIPAYTIAQFLHTLRRYDGDRQRALFTGTTHYNHARTVVIDEASMLTLDDLAAVLLALDLLQVQRIILVGDPNQLPPIGAGRPFADLVAHLEALAEFTPDDPAAGALGRLHVEVRTRGGHEASDALRLASWFTRDPQPVDADYVLDQIASGTRLNDLDVRFWKTPAELRERLLEAFGAYLGMQGRTDTAGFDRALGIGEGGRVRFDMPDGVEHFQILAPTRIQPHGVYDLNRWLQRLFRHSELRRAHGSGGKSLGQEEIVHKDKVIQVRNERRRIFDRQENRSMESYIANGEIGIIAWAPGEYMNVAFSGHTHQLVGYKVGSYVDRDCPLELAYALTIHKAQGSQFDVVFVVIPERGRGGVLSRELLYTALTRARERLVLLVQGDDSRRLYSYSLPAASETARRNTNLFTAAVRDPDSRHPLAEYLIHRTLRGELVRSKSELVIANILEDMDIPYTYEDAFTGAVAPGQRYPDFTFATPAGDRILWEHLGMLNQPEYARGWEEKRLWYQRNGFSEGVNLFTTRDDERGGLDSREVQHVAVQIQRLL